MASTPPRPEPAGRDLPAPYVSPWRLLGQALQAVLASLRLKLRELLRRNAAADLPLPRFWPPSLAAWFWPLLLGLALAVLLAPLAWRHGVLPAATPSGAAPGAADGQSPARASQQDGAARPELSPATEAALPPQLAGEEPAAAGIAGLAPAPPVRSDLDRGSAASVALHPEPLPAPAESEPPGSASQVPDPADALLALLRNATPDAPPRAVAYGEDPTLLLLYPGHAFDRGEASARQAWADRWLELAREQGFAQLVLIDGAGRLQGRQARVGSGMILLQPFREPP